MELPNIVRLSMSDKEFKLFRVEFDCDVWFALDKRIEFISKGQGYFLQADDELNAYKRISELMNNREITRRKEDVIYNAKRYEIPRTKPFKLRR